MVTGLIPALYWTLLITKDEASNRAAIQKDQWKDKVSEGSQSLHSVHLL